MTNEELWKAVLGEIELTLSKAQFTTWFKNTSVIKMEEDSIWVSVPNIFAKEWLEKKHNHTILTFVRKYFPKVNRVSCIIGAEQSLNKEKTRSIDSIVINNNIPAHQTSDSQNIPINNKNYGHVINKQSFSTTPSFKINSNLNPRYKFENFVVGSNNELAYAACRAVAENPGKNYNPVFIYGGVGLGKTHLIQSTGNIIQQNFPQYNIKYISMERFANELVDAIQNNKAKEFKNNYIKLDGLILDDVQFLSGREKTQEEFFHVFESLYQLGKQIILSSDRPPKSIPTLEDRLRSRFEGGMMADINKPDLETRMAIIKKKLAEKKFYLNDEIIAYLAESIYHNVRELEGALNKIVATYQLNKQEPAINDIIEMTKDVISANRQKDLTADKIIQSVAEFFDVKPLEITNRSRKKKLVRPRQILIYLIRKEIGLSFPEIGELIGGRDHSTAIYAFEKVNDELIINQVLQDQVKFIREKFIEY